MNCDKCKHEGSKYWVSRRGDDEEMRSFCFLHKIYEPSKVCKDYKTRNNNEN